MTEPAFAYALIALGMLLLFAELVLPTGGILFVLALGALVAGLAMSFVGDTARGVVTLIVVFILLPILAPLAIKLWPKTALGKKFFLERPEEDVTVASMAGHQELGRLKGRYGRTLSTLRPSGLTEFDGRRVDTITQGEMIDANHWVRCVEVRAGRVIVRQAEKPPDLEDFNPDDLRRDVSAGDATP